MGICTPARATVATDRGVRQSLRPFAGRFSQRRNSAHREVSPENRPLTRRPAESLEKNAQRSEKTRGLSSETSRVFELSPRVFSDRWAFFSERSAGRRVGGRFLGETSPCAELYLGENHPAKGRRLGRTPRSVVTVARAGVQMPTNAQIVCEKSSIFAPTSLKTSACLSLPCGEPLFLSV